MTTNRILTKQIMRLDYRIWHVLLVQVVLSSGLLGYRLINVHKCKPVSFSIKSITAPSDSVFTAGDNLNFVARSEEKTISWDFGDHSTVETGQYVTHQFQMEGTYYVIAYSGSTCGEAKKIIIKPLGEMQQNVDSVVKGGEIIGPPITVTGKEVMFSCMITAGTYEWSVPNYPKMLRTGPSVKYQFPIPGTYTVQVTLDNNREKRYTKEITVEEPPKPTPDVGAVPQHIVPLIPPGIQVPSGKKIIINDAIFLGYMEKVVNKEMKAEDFSDYLCNPDTKALVNGKLTSFSGMCDELSGKKRKRLIFGKKQIKISSAIMRRDATGCVTMVEVQYH